MGEGIHSTFSVPISILITPPQPPQYYNRTIIILCYITDIKCSTLEIATMYSVTQIKMRATSPVPQYALSNWATDFLLQTGDSSCKMW